MILAQTFAALIAALAGWGAIDIARRIARALREPPEAWVARRIKRNRARAEGERIEQVELTEKRERSK